MNDIQKNIDVNKSKIKPLSISEIQTKFTIDGKADTGDTIKLIYAMNTEFVVYETVTNRVRVFTNDDHLPLKEGYYYKNEIFKLEPLIAQIHSLRPEKLKKDKQTQINSLLARALVVAYVPNKDLESAKLVLTKALNDIRRYRYIEARLIHLRWSFFTCIIILLVTYIVNLILLNNNITTSEFSDLKKNIIQFSTVIFYGSIGGLLSVSIRLKQIKIDPDNDLKILGVARIFTASLSSVVLFVGIKAGIVFSFSSDATQANFEWIIKFLSVIAGFSETLILNIIGKFSNQISENTIDSNEQLE